MQVVNVHVFHDRKFAQILPEYFNRFRNKFVYSIPIVKFNFKRQDFGYYLRMIIKQVGPLLSKLGSAEYDCHCLLFTFNICL